MNYNPFMAIIIVVITILFTLLFVNMFAGVVIETFNREKDQLNLNNLLSFDQRSWILIQNMSYRAKPIFKVKTGTGNSIRDFCIKVTSARSFETVVMMAIIVNTLVLSMRWFGQSDEMVMVLEFINFSFNILFTIEAIVKIIALKKGYFRDPWNNFDFTIVALTYIFLVLKYTGLVSGWSSTTTILRCLRMGRILRLIKRATQLQIIFYTLLDSMTSLGSLGLLLLLFFFMFAVIGMQNFGLASIGPTQSSLNVHVNFQTFSPAFLTLTRCATGEEWD